MVEEIRGIKKKKGNEGNKLIQDVRTEMPVEENTFNHNHFDYFPPSKKGKGKDLMGNKP